MSETLPYRPHDVMAWDSSTTVQRMSFANRGVYHSVLDMQWKDGFVDADPLEIKATIRCSDAEWEGFEKHFEKCFPLCEDGKRRNPKCVLMREKAIIRVQKNRENGKLGGRPQKENEEPNAEPNGKPKENPTVIFGLSETEPNQKQSKSKSESSDISPKEDISWGAKKAPPFVAPSLEEVIAFANAERLPDHALVFWNHFESNGWLVGGRSKMRSWPAAYRKWCARSKTFGGPPQRESMQEQKDRLMRELEEVGFVD